MTKTATKLPKTEIVKMQKELAQTRKFLKQIEDMGGKVPKKLTKALKLLDVAIKTGIEVADSAETADKELKKFTSDLKAACKPLDWEQQGVCEARIAREFKANGVSFLLNPKNKKSVTSGLLNKIIKKATPDAICKHWGRCAKIEKSAK